MNQEQLKEILQKHKDWLDDIEDCAKANLKGADLQFANLEGADLRYFNLHGADLEDANLKGADLINANLVDANLRGADLKDANLYGADLKDANLRYVNLRGAKLKYAYLHGAYLSSTRGIIHWQSPLGEKRICYSVKHDDCVMHQLGCFWGDTDEAIEAIREKYGDDSLYEKFLLMQVEALEEE
jgi:uncharacterized protein YjbI with pentapeptide repeats